MSAQLLKRPSDFSKLVWSEESKCWTCRLCQKAFRSLGAHNRHARKDCENAQPENPSWKLGWDRKTMSCRYCKQTFVCRQSIRRHLQLKSCPSLRDWGRLFGYSHRMEESHSARQNQGRGRGRGRRVRSNKGRAKGIGQQRQTPIALPGTEYKEENYDDSDEEEDDEEEESSPLFPGENHYLVGGGPQEERPREGPQQGLSGGWPSDLRRQSRTSGDRPHLYSPRQKPDHMQGGRSDRHSKQYMGHGLQGQSADQSRTKEWPDSDMFNSQKTLSSRCAQSSSRDLERCSKGSLDNPPNNWPSDRSFHSSHTNAAWTWTGSQRARTGQKWLEQEFQHGPEDRPEKQYDQNSSFDGRYISTGHESVSRHEHNTELIHRNSRERQGRSTHAKHVGERLSSRDRFDAIEIKFPSDRYPDKERRKNSDIDGSHEGRFISDRHGSQQVSHHSRDMSPWRMENCGTYHKSPERMERHYSFNHESPPESRHDSYKSSEKMESYDSYRESPERMERLGFYKGFERMEKHGSYRESPERLERFASHRKSPERLERFASHCKSPERMERLDPYHKKSPERMERLSSYHKSRDRTEGHGSYHGTPDRLERHGSHHNKYHQRSHSPIRPREIESELDRRSQYSERRNQALCRNGKRSPTSYRHQENSRLLDPDSHQERMLRCSSVERFEERPFPDVCDSVERMATPVRDDPFWMSSLESRNSPGERLSPEGHFQFGLGITRLSPCQEGRGLRDYPRRHSHSPRHRETEHRRNSRSRYSEAEIHYSTFREKEREELHRRDYSLRRHSRSPIRRETESKHHSRSRHSEAGILESSRRLGSLPQDSSLSRAQHHSPKRFGRSPHRCRETENRRHSRSRHSETGMLESTRRLGSLLQDSRSPHHFSRRFSHSPDRRGETESRQLGRSRHSETRMLESSRRLGSLPQDSLSRAWHHSPRRSSRSPVRLGKTENRRHRSRHSETEMLESSRRLGSLPQDRRSRHHFSKRFSRSPDRLGETEKRQHSRSRHSETGVLESSQRLGSLPQDSRAWYHSPRTSRRLSHSPVRIEIESRRHSRSRHSETGVLESSRGLGSLSQDGRIRHHSPGRLSCSPHRIRETQQDSRSQYLETGSGNSSRRRNGSGQGRDQRGHSPRRRSRSPVRHRESGGHRDSGLRHAERETQDSYRTHQSRERRPVPEEPRRQRTHHEDRHQEPRERGRSHDTGYRGHQRDREKGRHQRYF